MSKKTILTTMSIDIQKEKAQMPRVMVESPLGGAYWDNIEYARLALVDATFSRGESPMAFHLIYNKALRDGDDVERSIGIKRSFNWHSHAEKKAFYLDRGLSNGMIMGYLDAQEKGIETEFRVISKESQINALVTQFNSRKMNLPELESVSAILKKLIVSNEKLSDFGVGDATNYRNEEKNLISVIGHINNGHKDNKEKAFNCLAMRDSLMTYGESPLILEEFYDQFLDINDRHSILYLDIAQSWLQVADEVIPFNNPYSDIDESLMDLDKRTIGEKMLDEMPIIEGVLSEKASSRERGLLENLPELQF